MHSFVAEMLQCPACHGGLTWQVDSRENERVVHAEASCRSCSATYPVRDGIGIFLTPDLPRNDYWEASGSGLHNYLRDHPDIEQQLMGAPIESLNPTDQYFRASMLALAGRYAEAEDGQRIAFTGLYTQEQREVTRQQFEHLVGALAGYDGPIVDLACGTGQLAQTTLRRLPNPVLMTDFSPRVLRENRLRLMASGLYDKVSLLSFDARRTPFRDGVVRVMTTYAGLGNIEQPGALLRELRRAVSGHFLALSHFCPEDDPVNGDFLRQAGMEQMFFRRLALQNFTAAGWQVEMSHAVRARVVPTPPSDLIPDATVDGFPVAPSEFELCVLDAH